jgi:ferredoxin
MTVTMKDNPKHAEGTSKRRKIIDEFYIDYGRCMRCNICVEVCNFDAIVMNNTWKGVELSRYDRQDLVMDLPELLRQSRSGDLEDPFREPMGVAHSGWAPKMDEEEERAAEAASATRHHGTSPDAPAAPTPTPDPTAEAPPGSEAKAEAPPSVEAKAEAPPSVEGKPEDTEPETVESAQPERVASTVSPPEQPAVPPVDEASAEQPEPEPAEGAQPAGLASTASPPEQAAAPPVDEASAEEPEAEVAEPTGEGEARPAASKRRRKGRRRGKKQG